MNLFRPLKNESGVAMIGLIVVVTAGVLSYTAFTASSYMMMMTEAKRQKRQALAFELIGQFATIVTRARQDQFNADQAAIACPGTQVGNNFCFQTVGGATEDCVINPMTGNPICIANQVPAGASPAPTVPVVLIQEKFEPNFIRDKILNPIRDFNRWYGKNAVMVAKAITDQAPVAHAKIRAANLPVLGAVPAYTLPTNLPAACAANSQPSSRCMSCQESGVPAAAGAFRPACIRLKVCVVSGGCAAGNEDEWLWQTIAVTAPLQAVP